jgi:cell wall-associated NlpC family hydrolase
MPRRLVIALLVASAAAATACGPAGADTDAAAIQPVQSPVQFVLPDPPKPPTLAERVVELARRQLGVPYVWGGASPSGFDCSGLVMWVYGRVGVSLPHNAAALYAVGRPVHGKPHVGDLVFFSGLGHVGLYIGHGQFIHAPQSGRSVEIQPLSERLGSIVGMRRVTDV